MRSLLLLSICAFALGQEPHYRRMPDVLPADSHSKYIIKFKDSPSVVRASSFVKAQAAQVSPLTIASISSAQGIQPDQFKYGISSTYNSTFLNAVAVTLSEEDMGKLKKRYGDKIEYIEPDLNMYAFDTQENAPWGLARVGQWDRSTGRNYNYPGAAGEGVDVYVMDMGLVDIHPSFEGRAKLIKNFAEGSSNGDPIGHGTHVAGIIGSSRYGVAKKANIYGIKVLGDKGMSTRSSILDGIQFVTAKAKPGKTVLNMSLGGPNTRSVNDAVAAARKAGVLVVAAAGNNAKDACGYSPANSRDVITVGATDHNDNITFFSNWGKCVDVFAPGLDIISLGRKGKDYSFVRSGTSMAAPHISGIAAVYMSIKSYKNPEDVKKDILAKSRECVTGNVKGSPRLLAYINADLQ